MIPKTLDNSGMWILPETPIWLAEKDRLDEALASLAWLRNNEVKILTSQSVLYVIDNNQETGEEVKELEEKCQGRTSNASFREKLLAKIRVLKSRSFWKPFMLAEPLNILYACSGTSILQFYIVTIFEESGSSVDSIQVFKESIKRKLDKIFNNCAGLLGGVRLETVHFLPELRGVAEVATQASVPLHNSYSLSFDGFSWCLFLLPGNTKGNKETLILNPQFYFQVTSPLR